MTSWIPSLENLAGPLYIRLANRIERDIENGALPAGTKLPPHRNLAFDIGVTVGTVSRAYAVARERGLVTGEVGRGTYVSAGGEFDKSKHAQSAGWMHETQSFRGPAIGVDPSYVRLDTSAATPIGVEGLVGKVMDEAVRDNPIASLDYMRDISPLWREAGAKWLREGGDVDVADDLIMPVQGAHSGLMAIVAAMSLPGDKIAFEALTYGTIPRSVQLMGRRVATIEIDKFGIIPDSFEHVCAQQHPKLLFVMPALHNPTAFTMPTERRKQVLEIARKYNVMIMEDNLYGSLCTDTQMPFITLAPEITFHVGGLTKSVAAGLRSAWIACPSGTMNRVLTANRLLSGGDSFIRAETAARLVLSGNAAEIRDQWRIEVNKRAALMEKYFSDYEYNMPKNASFMWLKLPEPWLSGMYKNAANELGIRIDDEDEFKVGRSESRVHGVRIAFGNATPFEMVEQSVKKLVTLLKSGPAAYHSFN